MQQVMREIRDEHLDFWVQNNFNVLFTGHYGSGKTTRILDAFERNKLKYKYFSASTMDPWCDFIGIPKVVTDENGPYLEYVLPRDMRDDTIEAIYMDEFNRAHKKVLNAVMELLQFKSINGRPFKKLRFIWAAINPDDEGDYQVELLDKSQKDRFQVRVNIPYEPSVSYFTKKFGSKQAKVIVNWWESLASEQQMEVSPRRLEYALQMFNLGGNIKDVLPHSSNPAKLGAMLKTGPVDEFMKEIFNNQDVSAAKKLMLSENNYAIAIRYLFDQIPATVDASKWTLFFLQNVPSEKLSSLLTKNEVAYNTVINNYHASSVFQQVVQDILAANTDKSLSRRLKRDVAINHAVEQAYHSNNISANWKAKIADWMKQPMVTTIQRMKIYNEIVDNLPANLHITEAVDTLEIFGVLFATSHISTLHNASKLVGSVNHCIEQIHKLSGLSWNDILTNYGLRINTLLHKLEDANLDKGVFRPVKKAL